MKAIICTGGPLYRIAIGAETFLFEDHPYCGPMPVRKTDLGERRLAPKHRFWKAVTLWAQQGRRVGRRIAPRAGMPEILLCDWRAP